MTGPTRKDPINPFVLVAAGFTIGVTLILVGIWASGLQDRLIKTGLTLVGAAILIWSAFFRQIPTMVAMDTQKRAKHDEWLDEMYIQFEGDEDALG